ncbi:MAG: hypothetical protein WDO12_13100 [Pseudomonadota bacterium]
MRRWAVGSIAVTPVLVNASGQIISTGADGQQSAAHCSRCAQVTADAGLASLTTEQLQALRFRVDGAQVAQ